MLKDKEIKSMEIKDKNYKVSDGKGLYILVNRNGSKYWRLKYRHKRKERIFAIGVYPEISLAMARKITLEARWCIREGLDLTENKLEIFRRSNADRFIRKPANIALNAELGEH